MIKRTLLFENPVYLSQKLDQIIVKYQDEIIPQKSVPIEDVGIVVLEHVQITVSHSLLNKLIDNNVAIITCNSQHLPSGMFLPLNTHSAQSERIKYQINASVPLKKNLWQQTVVAKIRNQKIHLLKRNIPCAKFENWEKDVRSGDSLNHESRAAVFYWNHLFGKVKFIRDQIGLPPNNLLNYGYSILRGITARAIVGSGMLPILGIFHKNKYNAYCLADDIMEPYRPYVDLLVCELKDSGKNIETLNTEIKQRLLQIATMDVLIDGKKSPLLNAMSRTTNSLFECFEGTSRKILYPILE
jgi:CRISPR-associated protein Cas1